MDIANLVNIVPWGLVTLAGFCIINFVITINCIANQRKSQLLIVESNKKFDDLVSDVRALYESSSTLGGKISGLEFASKILKEEQEQLTLKEPSQQMYQNATQLLKSGESVNKISESSGLSRGEVELLSLFQRINQETNKTPES